MNKFSIITFLTIALLSFSASSYAETTKVITLKDGSVLKGKVLELKSGVYTIETSNLGNIEIAESNILSITAPQTITSTQSASDAQKAELKKQVEQMQGTILTDQGLMGEIEQMVNDEEIKALLSDPKLMEDVMSFDQNKLEQNTSVQDLMNNPKMQNLMNKIQQKMPAQQ